MTAIIETQRLILRQPEQRDTNAAVDFYISDRGSYAGATTVAQAWRKHAQMAGHWTLCGFGMFTIVDKETDAIIGMCGAHFPGDWPERELGWHIWSEAHEGKGIAFEAAKAVRRYFYDTLEWNSVVSYIHPDNHRSRNLAKRLGAAIDSDAMKPEGHNCLIYRHPSREALS
ncbi:MAG: GNAT family N-acetyltransferase [Paracoccaceae bacterium]